MSVPKFVFAPIDTPQHQLEQLLEQYDLVIGPLLPSNHEVFNDFIALVLPTLVEKALKERRQIYLHLKPTKLGWLIEQINQSRYRGLNQQNLNGLVLDSSDYRGSLRQLSVEASSFEGEKLLLYRKRSTEYCESFLRQAQSGVWSGLFLFAEGLEETDRYNQSTAVLKNAHRPHRQEKIWVEWFSNHSLCINTTFLGADGFYTDISKFLPET